MTTLQVNDLQSLQTALKGLTTQLKKFSLDSASIKVHAAEILQKQEEEKDKKERENSRKKFKLTKSVINEFVDHIFYSMTDLIDEDVNRFHGTYDVQDYLIDTHGELVEKWKKRILVFKEEMRDELSSVALQSSIWVPEGNAEIGKK